MLNRIVRLIGGDPHKKKLEEFAETVDAINALEEAYESFSVEQLRAKTDEFRLRLVQGETLDDLLVEAYAVVREVSKRTLGLRHYDVQLIGGIAMHKGIIAEMKTGEGKTLAATMPLYLNSLALNPKWIERARERWGDDPATWEFHSLENTPISRGVHLITVNDYLARRDARWMGPIYDTLGLRVGVLQMAARTEHGKKAFLVDLEKKSPHEDRHQLDMVPRKQVYAVDIVYGTNNEFGFDYLRDNRAMRLEDQVQRGHYYAIIDEVDNVLIDEARTPLIISGPSHDDPEWYRRMARVVKGLKPEDYEINVRDQNITLTPLGETHVEEILGEPLRDPDRPEDITPRQARLLGYLEQALRAEYIYKRNKDYIVQAGKVVIVDEFTGRLMPGRRWSHGLHQAVEAKEGVKVQSENVTYATITIQNYFRMYEKLSGMTGTAVTEAEEFNEIYELDPIAIPTNLDYIANWTDSPLVAQKAQEPETGFEYTYYAREDDPDDTPLYWKRKDYSDQIYRTEEAKLRAIAREIVEYHVLGRPILVGTTSVEMSERVSNRLSGSDIRTLAYVLLIRDAWERHTNQPLDGRQVRELKPLNEPLEKLRPNHLRHLVQEMGLDLVINIKSPENIDRLLEIFGLPSDRRERLINVLQRGVDHNVLNARKHTEESQIIAGAGAFGAVTIATNMAGRGVDIKLGGEMAEEVLSNVSRILKRAGYEDPYDMTFEERRQILLDMDPDDYGIYETEINHFLQHMEDKERVKELGGLHVIGSERHEARRIDNQLRGRAARQGDPGSSRFYLSLEDELMVRFGGQQMEAMMSRFNVDEAVPIQNPLVDRLVESSQKRVEGANFDVRKHLLEYDDVLNQQREKIYAQRERIFTKPDLSDDVTEMLETEVEQRLAQSQEQVEESWKILSWLMQIQPTLRFYDEVYPSYTNHLLLEQVFSEHPDLTRAEAPEVFLDLAQKGFQAEQEHILNVLEGRFQSSEFRYQRQLEERRETLDTYVEGLALADDEGQQRNWTDIRDELSGLLRTRFSLSQADWRALLEEDPYPIKEKLEAEMEDYLKQIEVKRLVGGTERTLKTTLDLSAKDFEGRDWEEINAILFEAVNNLFALREQRFFGDEDQGTIARDLAAELKDVPEGKIDRQLAIELLRTAREGKRSTFDKKSHRRIWVRTNRLNYAYYAAQFLNVEDYEALQGDILAHLKGAQNAILRAWGRSERQRLGDLTLAALDGDLREGLRESIGADQYQRYTERTLAEIPDEVVAEIEFEFGRFAMSQIYRELLLRVISELWVDYLTEMEALRVSIGLEAYAQRDPLVQYKTKAFDMFRSLMRDMRQSVVTRMFTFRPRDVESVQAAVDELKV